jgi:hypothetical protein
MPLNMKEIVRVGRIKAGDDICKYLLKNGWSSKGYNAGGTYNCIWFYKGTDRRSYPQIALYYRESKFAGEWCIVRVTTGQRIDKGFGLETMVESLESFVAKDNPPR